MKEQRTAFAIVAFKGSLYAIGGRKKDSTPLSSAERYEPNKGVWSNVKHMLIPRAHLAASVLGNWIYVCGGMDVYHDPLQSCERYDPADNVWEPIANMAQARMGHSLVTVNGRLYAIGGFYLSSVKSVEMYDPAKNEWSAHPPPLLNQRTFSSAVVLTGMYRIKCK